MTVKQIHIEKYDIGSFEKEQKPYAMILNEVIQNTPYNKNNEVFMWIYLESLPSTWKPCKQHIMKRFKISSSTYERRMAWLNASGLIEYRQDRETSGVFGKGRLVVLNGSRFNPDAVSNRIVKFDGAVVSRIKKAQVVQLHRIVNSPESGQTDPTAVDAHINTITTTKKDIRKKTNNKGTTVSVFLDTQSVKNHIEMVIANRQDPVDDEIINQGVFYAFTKNIDKSFDSVTKLINVFLKKVREGKWLMPQGYNDVTTQSIRRDEEELERKKQDQHMQEAKVFRQISGHVMSNHPYIKLSDRLAAFRDGLANANS